MPALRFALFLWCGVASRADRGSFWFRLRRDTFRKEYKEKHPDVKQVSVVSAPVPSHPLFVFVSCCSFELLLLRCEFWVLIWFVLAESQIGKAGGEKWKSLSDAVSCPPPLPSLLPLDLVLVTSF